jgi:hypothetical protein
MAEAFEFHHSIYSHVRHGWIAIAICIGLFCEPSCVFARQGMTCGVDALYEICLQYRLSIPFEKVHAACQPSEKGNSMYDLYRAAEALGFTPRGLRLTWDDLLGLDCPAIAFVQGNHFVAVTGSENGRVRVVDYPQPERLYSKDEFLALWKGETLAVALEKEIEPEPAAASAPRIRFERTLVDFGMVSQGEAVKREFFFWNDGAEPLRIDRVSAGCGCTAPVLSATEIAPGEMGTLNVELDTRGRRGRDTQALALLCNDPLQPKAQLTLTGIVKVDMVYAPKSLYFGEVERGKILEREVIIVDNGTGNLAIENVVAHHPALTVCIEPFLDPHITDGLSRFRILVSLNSGGLDPGRLQSSVTIATSHQEKSSIDVPILADIVGSIVVSPPSLFMGFVKNGVEVERIVTIRDRENRPFRIAHVESNIDGLQYVCGDSKEKVSHDLKLKFVSRGCVYRGRISGIVRIKTDTEEGIVAEIPVSIFVREGV